MYRILFTFQCLFPVLEHFFDIKFVRAANPTSVLEKCEIRTRNVSRLKNHEISKKESKINPTSVLAKCEIRTRNVSRLKNHEIPKKESKRITVIEHDEYSKENYELVVFLEFEGEDQEINKIVSNINRELMILLDVIEIFNSLTILIGHKTNGSFVLKYFKYKKIETKEDSSESDDNIRKEKFSNVKIHDIKNINVRDNRNLVEYIGDVFKFLHENCSSKTILIMGITYENVKLDELYENFVKKIKKIGEKDNEKNVEISLILFYEQNNYDTIIFPKKTNLICDSNDQSLYSKCYYNTLYSLLVILFKLDNNEIETNIIQQKYIDYKRICYIYKESDVNIRAIKIKYTHFMKYYKKGVNFRKKIRNRIFLLLADLLFLDTINIYLCSKFLNKLMDFETNKISYYSSSMKKTDLNILRNMIINAFLFTHGRIISIINIQKNIYMSFKKFTVENSDQEIAFLRLRSCNFNFFHWESFEIYCKKYAIEIIQEKIKGIELLVNTKNRQELIDREGFFYIPSNLKPFYLFYAISKALCYDYTPTIKTLVIISALCLESEHEILQKRAEEFMKELEKDWLNIDDHESNNIGFVMFILKYRKFCRMSWNNRFLETVKYIRLFNFSKNYLDKSIATNYFDEYKSFYDNKEVSISYLALEKAGSNTNLNKNIDLKNKEVEYSSKTKIMITKKQSCNENDRLKKVEIHQNKKEKNCYFCKLYSYRIEDMICNDCYRKLDKLEDGEYFVLKKKISLKNRVSEVIQKISDIFESMYEDLTFCRFLINLDFNSHKTYEDILLVYSKFRFSFEEYLLSNQNEQNKNIVTPYICILIDDLMADISYESFKYEQGIDEETFTKKTEKYGKDEQNSNFEETKNDYCYKTDLKCFECEESYEFFELYTICFEKKKECLICSLCVFKIYDEIRPGSSIKGSILFCKKCCKQRSIEQISKFYDKFSQAILKNYAGNILEYKDYYICFTCNALYELKNIQQKSIITEEDESLLICADCDRKICKEDCSPLLFQKKHFINVSDDLKNRSKQNKFLFTRQEFQKNAYEYVFGMKNNNNFLHKHLNALRDSHNIFVANDEYIKYPRISDIVFYELKYYVDNSKINQYIGEPPQKKHKKSL